MISEFVPLPRWAGSHKMTLYAWAKRRVFPELPPSEARYFDVAHDARVLAHCHWQPDRRARPTLIALHGLEGSSDAHYIRGVAAKAWARGFNVVRLNQRNCGGTEHLSAGLYHSGLTADPLYVLRELIETEKLSCLAFAGYSLGGNLALKLAGELGADAPAELVAVAAVSPVIELESCVRAIERPANRLYEWNFCRNLQARMRRKARAWPGKYDTTGLWKVWSIRQFDDRYTAPHHGFKDAGDYYYRASAMRVIDRVAIPSLIVSAADDPFVPPEPFCDPLVTGNPNIRTMITSHGGHCGFVGESTLHWPDAVPAHGQQANGYDGYWAERMVVDFVASASRS
ncbi:MAG TPA: alpha/beta fold hydrolase [Vicinamibacterales bacterium]|nr:alpha/beta fold hydrolase [Vicinamibacterales bacterium]